MRKLITIGIFIIGGVQLLNHIMSVSDFLYGLLLGVGISIELIGIYYMKHSVSRLRHLNKIHEKSFC